MTTPMQQLADKIKVSISEIDEDCTDYDSGYKQALINILTDIEIQMLPIEKEYLSNIKTPKP